MLRLEQLARDVVANWESGDLAEAVRKLSAHLDEIKAEREAHECTIDCARNNYAAPSGDDIEIDDEPLLSVAGDGVGVSAWVWVPIEGEDGEARPFVEAVLASPSAGGTSCRGGMSGRPHGHASASEASALLVPPQLVIRCQHRHLARQGGRMRRSLCQKYRLFVDVWGRPSRDARRSFR